MSKHTFFSGQPILSQLIKLIPKHLVSKAVHTYKADHYYKRFKTLDHLVTMLYATLSHCGSLREIVTGMQASQDRLLHLGLIHTPRRSTLAEANQKRDAGVFAMIYEQLAARYVSVYPDSRTPKLKKPIYIVDSTTISLFSDILKNAGRPAGDGRRKGGAKAHSVIRSDHLCVEFMHITDAAAHDTPFLKQLDLPAGSVVCFDRGYLDYGLFDKWSRPECGIHFVTRLRSNADYTLLTTRSVSQKQQKLGLVADRWVRMGNSNNRKTVLVKARLVDYRDPKSGRIFTYLTNIADLDGLQIAAIYQKRWQIETVFKRIKQAYPLRYFYGESVNAIKIQLWCAFIADFLMQLIARAHKKRWSYANIRAMVRLHLFSYVNLDKFLLTPEKALIHSNREARYAASLFPV